MSDEERDYDAEAADRDDYEHDRKVEDRLEAKSPRDRAPHPNRRPGVTPGVRPMGMGRPGFDRDKEIADIKERGLDPADEKRELYGVHLVHYKNQANKTQRQREDKGE
jgi:hypothetical protein